MTEGSANNSDATGIQVPAGEQHREAQQILKGCLGIANQYTKRVFSSQFESLSEKQSQSATDKGLQNDQDENSLQVGLQKVLLEKNDIIKTFHEAFSGQLRGIFQSAVPAAEPVAEDESDSLSLVNETQLEEALAIDNLEARLDDRFSDQLFGLEQRFKHLFPHAHMTRHNNPLCPRLFCSAFHEAISHLQIDVKASLYVYKIFDRAMLAQMGQLYQEANTYLIDRGVLPRLIIRLTNSGGGQHRKRSAPEEQPAMSEITQPVVSGAMPIQAQMFQAITQLFNAQCLSGAGDGSTSGLSAEDGSPAAMPATPLLLDTLSDLQQDLSAEDEDGTDLIGEKLKTQVKTRFGSQQRVGKAGSINQIDDETIDVISMIFDYILEDKSLPDFIKVLIGRLQIPILKVAIIDREFFSRKSHPARQLLNDLAYAGVGWCDESEAAKDRLYEKMESIVLCILHEFEDSVAIFQKLLDEFRRFIEEEKKNFSAAQEKISREVREAEHRERIKIQVAETLADKLKDAQLPDDVRDFLMTGWRRVMTETALHPVDHEAEKQRSLQVVDDLIWSLQPKTTPEERKKMVFLLPLMLDVLREGMSAAAFNDEEIEAVTAMLEVHHLAILKTHGQVAQTNEIAASENHDDEAAEKDIDHMIATMKEDVHALPNIGLDDLEEFDFSETSSTQNSFNTMMAEMGFEEDFDSGPRIEDEYTEIVRNLQLGTWLDLSSEDGKTIRVKLAWKGDQFTNFSFMNRQYKVVAERPFYVLAEEMRQGRAVVIEDVALFDRALNGVISGIMKIAG